MEPGYRLVGSHKGVTLGHDLPGRQRKMRRVGQLVAESDQSKIAFGGAYRPFAYALDQSLGLAAVMDQIDDRADLEPMLPRKLHEIRQPRHRTVIVHDLAQHRSRGMPRQPREIAARL